MYISVFGRSQNWVGGGVWILDSNFLFEDWLIQFQSIYLVSFFYYLFLMHRVYYY